MRTEAAESRRTAKRERARPLCAVFTAAVLAVWLTGIAPARTIGPPQHKGPLVHYELTVSYLSSNCGTSESRRLELAPLILSVDGDQQKKRPVLSRNGTASFSLPSGKVTAEAYLADSSVGVETGGFFPARHGEGATVVLQLGRLQPGANVVHLKGYDDTAPANVWSQMQENFIYARTITQKPLPFLHVKATPTPPEDDEHHAQYSDADHTMYLNQLVAYDDFNLAHEFGHFVEYSNIEDVPQGQVMHNFAAEFPDNPVVAFDEGWGDAYGAVEQQTPIIHISQNCDLNADLSAETPPYAVPDPVWEQFSEEAVSMVIYHLAEYFGTSADPNLEPVLDAIVHHPAGDRDETLKALRDSLIAAGDDQNSYDRYNDISGIFSQFGGAWGVSVDLENTSPPHGDDGTLALNNAVIRVTGPTVSSCQSNQSTFDTSNPLQGSGDSFDGRAMLLGPLDYTWDDDCLLIGGGADDDTLSSAQPFARNYPELQADLALPYGGLGTDLSGRYTVSVYFHCENAPDPDHVDPPNESNCAPWGGSVAVEWPLGPSEGDPPDPSGDDVTQNETYLPTQTIQRDTWTDIVSFDGTGRFCTILLTQAPCHTGTPSS